ncbi:MAG: hypothetical protein J0L77_09230 [Alphaproteobacteria bacterium]|nr:hypothetical protein [Alphaproteobacteria bacterium]
MPSPRIRTIRHLFLAVASCFALSGNLAFAQTQVTPPEDIPFQMFQSPDKPEYAAALKLMAHLYQDQEKTPGYWDPVNKKWLSYPMIAIYQIDLNKDKIPEIVAYPIEMEPEETGILCPDKVGCPYVVFEMNGNKIRQIALFASYRFSPDNSSHNGYTRLRAYTRTLRQDPNYYELFEYNSQKRTYEMLKR